jgi:hypothetical protein
MRARRAAAFVLPLALFGACALIARARSADIRRPRRTIVGSGLRLFGGDDAALVVLGDSNSCRWATGCADDHFAWPGRRALPPGWHVDNVSVPGMTATDQHVCSSNRFELCDVDAQCGQGGKCLAVQLADGLPASGAWRLERLIERYVSWNRRACVLAALGGAPQLVIALGTNDVEGTAGAVVAEQMLWLYDRAHGALPCFEVYVATLPPRRNVTPFAIERVNARVRAGMQRRGVGARVIAFDEVAADDLGTDGIHMSDPGQEHRAALAFAVLGW